LHSRRYCQVIADISNCPENIQALSAEMKQKVDELIQDVDIDLDAPLNDEDD